MQAARDFYRTRASQLETLAERATSPDHRLDLLALAEAWRDLACGWEAKNEGVPSSDQKPPARETVPRPPLIGRSVPRIRNVFDQETKSSGSVRNQISR